MSEKICPCGSGKNYADCCEKIIKGASAETPEALMRARYSAYAEGEIDFIMNSVHSSQRDNNDREEIRRWSQNSQWNGLEIIRTEKADPTTTPASWNSSPATATATCRWNTMRSPNSAAKKANGCSTTASWFLRHHTSARKPKSAATTRVPAAPARNIRNAAANNPRKESEP